MKAMKGTKRISRSKSFLVSFFSLVLVSFLGIASHINTKEIVGAKAADYSGVSSGFTRGSDGSISATFTVTNNGLDMKGWLLCLFESKPSINSSNKLTNSNDAHPYSYSAVKHYFFASSTAKTGSITVTWAANSGDQKQNWTSSTSTGASGKTLKDYVGNGTNWHLVIGPRHYNTSWGDSGVGAGTNGYWENCDYYVGSLNEVFPVEEKEMIVNYSSESVGYDGNGHSIEINVVEPSSGYTIKYRTSSSGQYNLTQNPAYVDAGYYTTYFQITASGYKTFTAQGSIEIQKGYPSYTAPTAKTGLVYNGNNQALVNAGSSNIVYSLNNSNYSSSIPTGQNAGTYTVYYKVEATQNYNGVSPQSFNVTIAKANPDYSNPTAKTGLIYNGNEQELVNSGSSNVVYSLDNVNYSNNIPKGKNAGNYTIYYKVNETNNYNGVAAKSFSVNIAKADPEYTAPTAKTGLIYNKNNQQLIEPGSSNVVYSLDNSNYSSDIPLGKDAGTYTVYYKVEETENYNGVAANSFVVNIAKADPEYSSPTAKTGLIYNENDQALVNAGSENVIYSLDNSNYSSNVPTGKNAGTYEVYYKVEETANFNALNPVNFDVDIAKANATYLTVPTARLGLNYIGTSQALINEGSSHGGTVLYSLDDINYSTTIPEKVLVGDYTVYYKIEGDSNYNGVDAMSLQISIYPNDKTALDAVIIQAKQYYGEIISNYPDIASRLNNSISLAESVSQDDNKTISEIEISKEDLIDAYDLAHAQVCDALILKINQVRYTDNCLKDIVEAENYYRSLSDNQKELVVNHQDLLDARELYDKLKSVVEVIDAIGKITYDSDCYSRILAAKEAFATLTKDEQLLIPTWFNNLTSSEDIYDMLGIISNLGNVEYTNEFKQALQNARNCFDALDYNEQNSIYNYQKLLDAEEMYYDVDKVVNLVNDIAKELEYVGTHNPEIEKARKAYDLLTDAEKALVPQLTYFTLTNAEEEYKELKIEHERREIEDREAGVAIATEGGSGIPNTVSIDINNSKNNQEDFKENIDYQTIQEGLPQGEEISSICSIKLYEERDGEIVELSLADIDENMSVVIKLDIPENIDDSNFRVVLLDDENNIIEMSYTYSKDTRQATIVSSKLGSFAFVTPVNEPDVEKNGLMFAIIAAIGTMVLIGGVGSFEIIKKHKKQNN